MIYKVLQIIIDCIKHNFSWLIYSTYKCVFLCMFISENDMWNSEMCNNMSISRHLTGVGGQIYFQKTLTGIVFSTFKKKINVLNILKLLNFQQDINISSCALVIDTDKVCCFRITVHYIHIHLLYICYIYIVFFKWMPTVDSIFFA